MAETFIVEEYIFRRPVTPEAIGIAQPRFGRPDRTLPATVRCRSVETLNKLEIEIADVNGLRLSENVRVFLTISPDGTEPGAAEVAKLKGEIADLRAKLASIGNLAGVALRGHPDA